MLISNRILVSIQISFFGAKEHANGKEALKTSKEQLFRRNITDTNLARECFCLRQVKVKICVSLSSTSGRKRTEVSREIRKKYLNTIILEHALIRISGGF